MPETDLEWALSRFTASERRKRYNRYVVYDEGTHPIMFASEQFRQAFFKMVKDFQENMCSAVVDSYNDRLKVTGFRTNKAEIKEETVPNNLGADFPPRKNITTEDPQATQLWDIWKRNRMDLRSSETHRESLLTGDGYCIVWPDNDGLATIWPQQATEFDVEYDPNNLGVITRACKAWWNDVEKRWYLNVYLPRGIEKYRVSEAYSVVNNITFPDKVDTWVSYAFTFNPYSRIPAFHLPNRRECRYGLSELHPILPIQDGLNKSGQDMLVTMEYAAFKQRYVIGLEPEIDPDTGEPVDQKARNYGVDRMMGIPDPEAKVGQFDATDLGQFLNVQDKFWMAASRIKGIPLHYFYITTGDFPSGEAIKSAEGRFTHTIEDMQTSFGNQWEDILKFCFEVEGSEQDDLVIDAIWRDATPRSDAEIADTSVKKRAVGVPRSQILRELGYTEEEILRFLEESDAEAATKMAMQQEFGPQGASEPGIEPGQPSRAQTRARQGVEGGSA